MFAKIKNKKLKYIDIHGYKTILTLQYELDLDY
jgi:hypothetical protein